ncbi:hypothetical protein [Nocardioides sp.]|uniref:hypothetical protein n=1 Tax=Nocardioides sp. TaxID=35761 RepID=UPI003517D8F4
MEILLWLLPAALTTAVAMAGVAWWGREGRGEVDREDAARRLGEALARERRVRPGYAAPRRPAERSGGVAMRAGAGPSATPALPVEPVETVREQAPQPVRRPAPEPSAAPTLPGAEEPPAVQQRRAS